MSNTPNHTPAKPTEGLPDLNHRASPTFKTDYGIGIVGAGSIVEAAHLPAYRKAGLNVRGIVDLDAERAAALADRFGVALSYGILDEMLSDPEVAIVDIAVPPWAQENIVRKVLAAGKDVLCQKPLAVDLEVATVLVEEAATSGRHLAVNENMRWDPAMRASRQLVREGWIGTPTVADISINYNEKWSTWPWLMTTERLTILFDAIHPLYSLRMIFGEPEGVFCATSRSPDQAERGETGAMITLQYPGELLASLSDYSRTPTDDHSATFRFDGTEGSIKGTLGIWYDYPHGRADTLEYSSTTRSPGYWVSAALTGRWIPDAFAGPMLALMESVDRGTEPENSGAEHLKTLRLIEAIYLSSVEKRMVSLSEIAV